MPVRACSRCGAPLDLEPGQTIIRCQFCGAENDLGSPPNPLAPGFPLVPPPYKPHVIDDSAAQQRKVVASVIGGVVGALTLFVIVPIVLMSARSPKIPPPKPTSATATAVAPVPTAMGPVPVPLSKLHGTAVGASNEVLVDAPGRIGAPNAFDPIASWDWAQSVASAWYVDSKNYGLSADAFGSDGLVDLTAANSNVYYTFLSKQCRVDAAKAAETATTSASSTCTLVVHVHATSTTVDLDSIAVDFNSAEGRRPVPKPPCSLGQAMTALQKRLTPRPRYSMRLEWNTFGMTYRISNGHDTASMEDVDISPSFCKSK